MARLFLLPLSMGVGAALSTPAMAQCGYGTSSQDCYHQQRDAEAARQAEQHYRSQMQSNGGTVDGGYQGDTGSIGARAPDYGYVAVVWHPEAADVWATRNRSSEADATASAMSACRDVMGDGCSVALSAWNSTIALAQGGDGQLAVGWGAKESEAVAKALENCRQRTPVCAVKRKFTAKPYQVAEDHYPGASVARMAWAMVGWAKTRPEDKWLGKVWLASGQGDYAQTKRKLLDLCQRDTGIECEASQVVMGETATKTSGLLASYYQPGSGTMWFASPSHADAEARIKRDCASAGAVCTDLRFFDPFTVRLGTVDAPSR